MLETTSAAAVQGTLEAYSLRTPGTVASLLEITAKTAISNMRRSAAENLTVKDAATEIYALWGFEIDAREIEFARERVVGAINAAVQTMHAQAHRLNYFNKIVQTVTVPSGGSVALAANIQSVLHVWSGTRRLREIPNKAEFTASSALYVGLDDAPDPPAFYHVEHTRKAAGDNVGMVLYALPSGSAANVTLEAAVEPPTYTGRDIISCTELQIPARYTESILWPLLRHWAASDALFRKESLRSDINARYESALRVLDLLAPPSQQPEADLKGKGVAA